MKYLVFVLIGLLALGISAPMYAVTAGITLDVHQDCDVSTGLLPNDFHVEGKICSHTGAPTLTSHVDGPFAPPLGTFSYTIVPVPGPGDWYSFTADWSFPVGSAGIAFCTMHHFGLIFDVNGKNVIINLVGWWTRDGRQIGDVIQGNTFVNRGYVPVTGFDVSDDPIGHGQTLRVTNGIQRSPEFPPLNPTPPSIPIEIVALDLIPFPADQQPPTDALREDGAQQGWQWIHAVDANGTPISTTNPMPFNVDSFFDVFFEVQMPGQPGVPQGQQFTIPPGGSLVARTLMRFTNNKGEIEERWQWDIHGQPTTPCDWNPNDPAKWLQMPDVSPTGIDIRVDSNDNNSRILADDFKCTQTGPITDFHFWGSWLNDVKSEIDRLTISLYSDVPDPDGTGPGFSQPGALLWQHIFVPGQFSEKLFATVPPDALGQKQYEWFWDPFTTIAPDPYGDQNVWQYDLCIDPTMAFVQQGTAANPIIYWAAVQVHVKQGAAAPPQFGWKTRDPIDTHYGGGHFMDDAVRGVTNADGMVSWNDLHYPTGHPLSPASLDMAFVITGQATPPPCCLQAYLGSAQPNDHTFTCVPGIDPPPNLMQHVKICNPCPNDVPIYGLKLQAGGTGNLGSIQQIQVFADADCNGQPDTTVPILTGNYDASGSAVLCNTTGPVYVLPPGAAAPSCVCFLIYYKMDCPATPGTYFFDLVDILGLNCLSVCTDNLPLRSAVKTVPQDCCLTIDKGSLSPPDHVYACSPLFGNPPNFMSQVRICNPCTIPISISGLVAQASGTGNDLTGIQQVQVFLDADCDGKPDSANPILTGTYTADDGVATLCDAAGGGYTLQPDQCICVLIYYQMDCNAPVGTYLFNVVGLLGPNCLPICANTHMDGVLVPLSSAPIQSAIKTIEPDQNPKWRQPPDLTPNGIDVKASDPLMLADDFQCTKQTKITDITVWGSWKGDNLPWGWYPEQVTFILRLLSDIPDPDGTGTKYSMPGNVLWTKTFGPGQFAVSQYATGDEGWYDPSAVPPLYLPIGDHVCWKYDFHIPAAEAFCQEGTAANPIVYWLDVYAAVVDTSAEFGWKTSSQHWNDDAVWSSGSGFNELRYPQGHPFYLPPPLISPSIDLAFEIGGDQPCEDLLDWGDAPDPTYPTLSASAGASHVIVPGMMLGTLIDAEPNGQPNATATGDDINNVDDEDGVVFTSPIVPGAPAKVTVTASIAGKLDAWMDFNADGDWADTGEKIFAGTPLAAGPNLLTFTVPLSAGAVGVYTSTYSRFRYSSIGGLSYTGPASDGEVEDYQVRIYPRPIIVTKSKAKCLDLGSFVLIKKNVITANFGNVWYFEEPDRFAALGVISQTGVPGGSWSPGDLVSCYGLTVRNGCELMLQELYSWREEGKGSVRQLGQNNRDSGGGQFCNQPGLIDRVGLAAPMPAAGLNSVAMLVTLWGQCTHVEMVGTTQTNFWIDDGSALWDGAYCSDQKPALGVKVRVPTGGPGIRKGGYYAVTGIMRTDTNYMGSCVRWLWPRDSADIVPIAD